MDYRQTPCADSDFSGYTDKPGYTGEHSISWPPSAMHRHPPTARETWLVTGCAVVSVASFLLAVIGAVTVWQWLF